MTDNLICFELMEFNLLHYKEQNSPNKSKPTRHCAFNQSDAGYIDSSFKF